MKKLWLVLVLMVWAPMVAMQPEASPSKVESKNIAEKASPATGAARHLERLRLRSAQGSSVGGDVRRTLELYVWPSLESVRNDHPLKPWLIRGAQEALMSTLDARTPVDPHSLESTRLVYDQVRSNTPTGKALRRTFDLAAPHAEHHPELFVQSVAEPHIAENHLQLDPAMLRTIADFNSFPLEENNATHVVYGPKVDDNGDVVGKTFYPATWRSSADVLRAVNEITRDNGLIARERFYEKRGDDFVEHVRLLGEHNGVPIEIFKTGHDVNTAYPVFVVGSWISNKKNLLLAHLSVDGRYKGLTVDSNEALAWAAREHAFNESHSPVRYKGADHLWVDIARMLVNKQKTAVNRGIFLKMPKETFMDKVRDYQTGEPKKKMRRMEDNENEKGL